MATSARGVLHPFLPSPPTHALPLGARPPSCALTTPMCDNPCQDMGHKHGLLVFAPTLPCPLTPLPPPADPPGPSGEHMLDCKASSTRGVLHPPPEKHKVAHGDVNLDINDFLAKIGV